MRRGRHGVGIGALKKRQEQRERAKAAGEVLAGEEMKHMEAQVVVFKSALEDFARKHKGEINRDPEFRRHFQQMTSSIGVDPLASNKGFWAEILGVGDFYYELGIQITDVCLSTRAVNGGLIDMPDLLARLKKMRGSRSQAISDDDVLRAIKKLAVLGNGFKVIKVGKRQLVLSVPYEMSTDNSTVLAAAEGKGYVTASELMASQRWDEGRAKRCLDSLLREGMAWLDGQAAEPTYWFPSIRRRSEASG